MVGLLDHGCSCTDVKMPLIMALCGELCSCHVLVPGLERTGTEITRNNEILQAHAGVRLPISSCGHLEKKDPCAR